MKKTIIQLIIIAVIIAGIASIGWFIRGEVEKNKVDKLGYSEADIVNVIGTAAAPYDFSATGEYTATTTGTIYVGNDINVLNFDVQFITTSSSNPYTTYFYVEKSNDTSCVDNGASIKWVDATPITTTAKTTTTTYPFTPSDNREGVTHQITNWNGLCARFTLASASTTVWVSASKQSLDAN